MWWILGLVSIVLMTAMSVVVSGNVASDSDTRAAVLSYAYSVTGRVGYMFPLMIGALIVTGEFRHRTLSRTLLNGQSRARVIAAKAIVSAIYGFLLGAICCALGAVGIAFVVARSGNSPGLLDPDQWGILLRTPVAFAFWALIGVGFGVILRNQVASIFTILGFTLLVEPILTSSANEFEVFATVGKFFPGAASMSLVWPPDDELTRSGVESLGWGAGGLVLLAYAGLLIAVGYFGSFKNRDVT
jgi:ABC-type transport system involved in multi-copper enzyme maturation permease subunit